MTAITEVAINVFGEKGDSIIEGEIRDFKSTYKNNSLYMSVDILSKGNSAIKISYLVKEKNRKIADGKLGNSLRNGENNIKKIVPLKIEGLNLEDLTITLFDQNNNILYQNFLIKNKI